ncbi:MAG: hypothetical protein GY694_03825 [Gammaproteobacteria bacterium]|nr:hypothetical protein [Gammaproteobacteria bacterium]
MSILQELKKWDGKTVNAIEKIYKDYYQNSLFIDELLPLIEKTNSQKGASWILKKYLESGGTLRENEQKKIYSLLGSLEHWEPKLHLLQCIPYIPVTKKELKKVEIFLRKCLSDPNKFVRTWAYNGFYELSSQYPEYQKETKKFFEMAMRDEAPSVKARIRNIMKKGF